MHRRVPCTCIVKPIKYNAIVFLLIYHFCAKTTSSQPYSVTLHTPP